MRLLALIVPIIFLVGCTSKTYDTHDIGQPMSVKYGEITSVQPVMLKKDDSGRFIGAVAGGVLGGQIGGGSRERMAMAVVGTLIGALAGDRINEDRGQQIILALENGESVATIMPVNPSTPPLMVGQKVQVFYQGYKIKNITPMQRYP